MKKPVSEGLPGSHSAGARNAGTTHQGPMIARANHARRPSAFGSTGSGSNDALPASVSVARSRSRGGSAVVGA